jgi:asparagine synthase (glutamine-hydrolysing)
MCGILGFIGPRSFDADAFGRALDVMANRGPDDRGVYEEPECLLGHRRLAILDLSPAGHQPMLSPDGRYVIVYNGEVYNFLELRRELEAEGQRFSTRTDTEVILALYAREGPACLDRFRGMFAIAIWDRLEKALFLARDRMGIKPLYIWPRPEGLAFASEVKTLRALPGGPSEIEPEALVQYLAWGHVPAPVTIARGVECVMPASWLLWKGSAVSRRTYWDFPAPDPNAPPASGGYLYQTREAALEAFRPLLKEAVAYRCISDAPLGAFLSGGIDSSSVVSLMRAAGQERIHTVSISFPQTSLDEGPYALKVAEQFGTSHTDLSISARAAEEELEGFFASMDQPTCDGFNTYVVSKHAQRTGLTVSMSGLGGDELFAGYSHYRRIRSAEPWLRQLPTFASLAARIGTRLGPRYAKLEAFSIAGEGVGRAYYAARGLFAPSQIHALLRPEVLSHTGVGRNAPETLLPLVPGPSQSGNGRLSVFHSIAALEIRRYMHDQLLRDSDVFGLANALEIRVPLIDHRLVEAVFQTSPGTILARNESGQSKALLLEALPSPLPAACINRRKMGFVFPFHEWIRGQWTSWSGRNEDAATSTAAGELLRPQATLATWEAFKAGRLHWSRPWALHVISSLVPRDMRFARNCGRIE